MIINCTECSNEVSDKATTCPKCGNPINTKPVVIEQTSKKIKAVQLISVLMSISAVVVMVLNKNAQGIILGAILIISSFVLMIGADLYRWWNHD